MYDLIIIGAGPAGLTAALYSGRFRLQTLILEQMAAGGQIILSSTIENFPGFPGGVSTQELIDKFTKQVAELHVAIENREVLAISVNNKEGSPVFNIKTTDESYETKSVIIACGASPKQLGIPGEAKFIGRGVSYCATCDGPLFRNKNVVVIGGGDRAAEEAIFLSSYAKSVYLVHRRTQLRASKILTEKARLIAGINFALESVVEEIRGRDKVEGVLIRNVRTNSQTEIPCEGVFVCVGIRPNTVFLKNLLEMDEEGFIMTDQEMRSSHKGLFACGDCRKKSLYQVISACAEGAIAADSAHRYLLSL